MLRTTLACIKSYCDFISPIAVVASYNRFVLIFNLKIKPMANSITTSSTTIEGQLIEIVSKLQELESDTNANPNGENRITGTFNTDTGSFTGTFTIAGSLASNANGFSVVVTPYLTEV